jgi:hypothetical protein
MQRPAAFVAFLLTSAAPAAAQDWNCILDEQTDGVHARLEQALVGSTLALPSHMISALGDGVSLNTMWDRHTYPSIDAPFAPPRRLSLGINLHEAPATRRVTLSAPGVAPITVRAWPWAAEYGRGINIELRGRPRVLAALSHRDWTAVLRYPDGRVQQMASFRMPLDLAGMRAIRDRQAARMLELSRDPEAHCERDMSYTEI